MDRRGVVALLGSAWAPASRAQGQRRLNIAFMVSSGQQRTAWVHCISQFQEAHPQIQIHSSEMDQERYKREFEARMSSGEVDVAFWFAGERLRAAVRKGLVMPLEAPALVALLRDTMRPGLFEAVRFGGQIGAMPLNYYPWGFYYRKSLFARLGLRAPVTWNEFLTVGDRLLRNGITPTAVGAAEGWPAAAWFDFLSLRLNGLEAHRHMLSNDASLSGPQARKVFTTWQGLLRRGYFLASVTDQPWHAVLPHLYRSEVGMVLLGAFATARIPASLRADIGYFGFPLTDLPAYEEAPLDVLVVSAASKHRADAQAFLHFVAQSGVLNELARWSGQLSPRLDAPAPDDPLLIEGRRVLDRSAGLSFFFDRDAREEMIEPSFALFRRLLTPPHDLP